MDRDPRFNALEKNDGDARLRALVEAQLDMSLAARKLSRQLGQTVTSDAFSRSINRLQDRLGFPSLADMLVWYELDYKGRSDGWRKWLGTRYWDLPGRASGLRYLVDILQAERAGIKARREHVRDQHGISLRALDRAIARFAAGEKLAHSLKWLLFVYCLYTELQKRKPQEAESA